MSRLEELKDVLKVQSSSYAQWRMFAYIVRYVSRLDGVAYYTDDGNIYITKGDAISYPCVVAHMDTVHSIVDDLSLLQVNDNITGFNQLAMTQTGVGGDDKVGIFIALQCLKQFDNIKIAFFRDEEVGCQGSYDSDMTFFSDVGFVLQCDRRGNKDFVTTASGVELSGKDFQKDIKSTIKKYGYSFTNGMMTDVMALKESGLTVAAANMSCGYYNPHSPNEYVCITDVMNCLDMVVDIITNFGDNVYSHVYAPDNWWRMSKNLSKSKQEEFDFSWDIDSRDKMSFCDECGCYEPKDKIVNGLCSFCLSYSSKDAVESCYCCGSIEPLAYDEWLSEKVCASCSFGLNDEISRLSKKHK